MCGRYVAATDAEGLTRFFVVDAQRGGDLPPSYNTAPTDRVPAVLLEDGARLLTDLRWGLVPFWAKDLSIGARMINARSETVGEARAFAESYRSRRCLLPADAFYEWERVDDGTSRGVRLPWLVRRTDGDPFALAGIWSSWRARSAEGDSERVLTCAVLTTRANGAMSGIHDRMPVVLERQAFDTWLDPDAEPVDLQDLLVPAADGIITRHRVSTRVNRVSEEGPELVEPLGEDDREGGRLVAGDTVSQPSLFD